MDKRASGVLMHITSLPGDYGIGSFGQAAYDFVSRKNNWKIWNLEDFLICFLLKGLLSSG